MDGNDAEGSAPQEADVPQGAACNPASFSKPDLKETLEVACQKDSYVKTLLTDNEYLNDVSLGFSQEKNLKQPFKCFQDEDQLQLSPLIDMQSEKLFAIVQKQNECQKKKVMAAVAAKKGVIEVITGTKVKSYLCHRKSVEQAKQEKSVETESTLVQQPEGMVNTTVDKVEETESTLVDNQKEKENLQNDKPENMDSMQVDKLEEMESTDVDKSEETESSQIDSSEEMESVLVDSSGEIASTQASTSDPFILLEGEARFGAEKLMMLRTALDAGWKREIVLRNPRSTGRKGGDVYYYSPEGQKFRTSKQLAKYLLECNSPFTSAHFSFTTLRISGGNLEQEIVRTAFEPKSPLPLAAKIKEVDSKDKVPLLPQSPSPVNLATVENPPMKNRRSVQPSKRYQDKVMLLPRRTPAEEEKYWSENADNGLLLMGLIPPRWPNEVDEFPSNQKRRQKQTTPCSIGCPGMLGMVPNLQCARCRCLFHMKCIGLRASIAVKNYLCLKCAEEQNFGTGPTSFTFQQKPKMIKKAMGRPLPDLTPISFMETGPATMATKVGHRSVPLDMIGNEGNFYQPPPQKIKRGRGRPPKVPPQQQSEISLLQCNEDLTITQIPGKPESPPPGHESNLQWMSADIAPFGKQLPVPKYMNPNAFKKSGVPCRSSSGSNFKTTILPELDGNEHERPSLVKRYPQTVCNFAGRKFVVLPKQSSADNSAGKVVNLGNARLGMSDEIVEDGSLSQVDNNSSVDVTMEESTVSIGSGSE